MLTGSSASPFAAFESAIQKTLFGSSPYATLTGEVNKACIDGGTSNTTTSTAKTKESGTKSVGGTRAPPATAGGQSGSLKAKETHGAESTSCKKTD